MKINYIAVLRDVVIIFVLSFLSGFVITYIGFGDNFNLRGISNLALISLGFLISGCLIKNERFKHLFIVALIVWLLGLLNIVLFGVPFIFWLIGIIPILISMGIGGGLSFLFVHPDKTPTSIAQHSEEA